MASYAREQERSLSVSSVPLPVLLYFIPSKRNSPVLDFQGWRLKEDFVTGKDL
jgi:hypothetical protein